MRFIPTRIHGWMDYITGALLIAAPWLFGFANDGIETWLPVILGASVILYSLFTAYELGAVRAITMPAHLWMDFAGGVLLAASPWLFGFADYVWMPHLIVGLVEVAVSMTTHTRPGVLAERPVRGATRHA